MKMNVKWILTSILILGIISCSFSNDGIFFKRNSDYRELKSKFLKELISHFPDTIYKNDSFINDFDYSINSIQFTVFSKNIENIDHLLENYKKQAKQIYKANDTCLLVLNGYINENNYYNTDDIRDKDIASSCDDSYLPVPNFWNLKLGEIVNKTRLPKDFDIYVFDAEPGIYWNQDLLKPSRSMPEKWKNGYSKGVAISKEKTEIIYWVIIW